MNKPQLLADQYRCPACKFTTGRVVFLAEGECPACGERYCGETVDELVIERARADERKKVIEEVEEWVNQLPDWQWAVAREALEAKLNQLKEENAK